MRRPGGPRLRGASALDSDAPDHPALTSAPVAVEAVHEVWEVRRAVKALSDQEREVVRLQHFEGLTHAQIAGRLGLAVGTVKSRSFRAHRRLAADLGQPPTRDRMNRAGVDHRIDGQRGEQ